MVFNWFKELIQSNPTNSAKKLIEELLREGLPLEQRRKAILLILQKKDSQNLSKEEAKLLKTKLLKPLKKYILKLQILKEKTHLLLPSQDNPIQKDLTETSQNIVKALNQKNTHFARNQTLSLLTLLDKYIQEKQSNLHRAKELLNITSEKTISQTQIKRTIQHNKELDTKIITTKINETIQLGNFIIPKLKIMNKKWKWSWQDKNPLLEETKKDIFPQLSLYLQSILEINVFLRKDNYPLENPIKNETAIRAIITRINTQQFNEITTKIPEKRIEQLLLLLLANCREKQRHLKTIKRKIKNLELSTDETIAAKAA